MFQRKGLVTYAHGTTRVWIASEVVVLVLKGQFFGQRSQQPESKSEALFPKSGSQRIAFLRAPFF